MQQQSYPSQDRHFVFSASGFTMLEMVLAAAEPGPLRLTNDGAEDWHILSVVWVVVVDAGCWMLGGLLAASRNGGHRYGIALKGGWSAYLRVTDFGESDLRLADRCSEYVFLGFTKTKEKVGYAWCWVGKGWQLAGYTSGVETEGIGGLYVYDVACETRV
jgi:hypothetical protein